MKLLIEQALYGYDEGHRRLASSMRLDKEADRILRVVTDLKVTSPERSYLTIVPLRSSGLHAFIRTWSAGPGFRPGSVWSHVLLMTATSLEQAASLGGILQAFRRPDAANPDDLGAVRETFQVPTQISVGGASGLPVVNAAARQIVAAAYDRTSTSEVLVDNASDYEYLLLALLTQGWPELRRSTALRTRHRRTESSVANFAVEVVERPSARRSAEHSLVGAWIDLLTTDLAVPNEAMRKWLHRFGADAGDDRSAMPILAALYNDVRTGNTVDVLGRIRQSLPDPEQLPTLKNALFGRSIKETSMPDWPDREPDRLALLLAVGGSVNVAELDVASRLIGLVTDDEAGAVQLAITADWHALPAAFEHDAFFVALRDGLSPRNLGLVAISVPGEAEFLLRTRPDAWSQSKLWIDDATGPIVRDLVSTASDSDLRATFVDLVLEGEVEVAGTLVRYRPRIWWSLLVANVAKTIVTDPKLAAAVRHLLEIAGPKNLGEPEAGLSSPEQLEAVVRVSAPDMRLWRSAAPEDWLRLVGRVSDASPDRTAAMTIALASAEGSKDVHVRERAWRMVFGDLHSALEHGGVPDGSVSTLDRALPGGMSWDWCGRLREGLARVAVDADWTPEEIRSQASGAGDYASDVTDRVGRRLDKHSGLLDSIARLFWP